MIFEAPGNKEKSGCCSQSTAVNPIWNTWIVFPHTKPGNSSSALCLAMGHSEGAQCMFVERMSQAMMNKHIFTTQKWWKLKETVSQQLVSEL